MRINGDEVTNVSTPLTVASLMALFNMPTKGVAVAVDGVIVPRSLWDSTVVASSANVEVVTAAAGG